MSAEAFASVAAQLRTATLRAWAEHPARFREDANAEEDHSAGWYRDRVVVELAQNAADAAAAVSGSSGGGRLLLALDTEARTLVAANTGVPLDAAGLTSLATLRASAKRGGRSVGRFGVGFAAVRSVADEAAVVSRSGAVHFSVRRTAQEIAARLDVPGIAEEVARRGTALPALRLPFDGPGPAADVPMEPWDTVVWLRLRDEDAVAEVRAQLADVDDALLLALPGLESVQVDVDGDARTLSDVVDRWVVVTATGELDPALLAERPVEEREHRGWRLTWAVPRGGRGRRERRGARADPHRRREYRAGAADRHVPAGPRASPCDGRTGDRRARGARRGAVAGAGDGLPTCT